MTEVEVMATKGYIPVTEAAAKVGKSKQALHYWLDTEKIKGVKIGSKLYVLWQSVLDYYKHEDPKALELLGLK
jgi:hypothetical protein